MDRETQFLQTVLDFRTAHKQTPQKARTVILDHRGDRTLVYCQCFNAFEDSSGVYG